MPGRRPSEPRPRERPSRKRVRLGVGAGDAAAKLGAAAAATALGAAAIIEHWNVFILVFIGAVWALIFGGLVVVPIVSGLLADSMAQHRVKTPIMPGPPLARIEDAWGERGRRLPPDILADAGVQLTASKGLVARQPQRSSAGGFDWGGLVRDVAERLGSALGDGFDAEPDDSGITLRHGDLVRKVNLGLIFQPPPLDIGERAVRGCLKMMDEAQMFSMRVRKGPWPNRAGSTEGGPGNLARPRVRLEEGEIRMFWADSWGPVLRLKGVPFVESKPKHEDARW